MLSLLVLFHFCFGPSSDPLETGRKGNTCLWCVHLSASALVKVKTAGVHQPTFDDFSSYKLHVTSPGLVTVPLTFCTWTQISLSDPERHDNGFANPWAFPPWSNSGSDFHACIQSFILFYFISLFILFFFFSSCALESFISKSSSALCCVLCHVHDSWHHLKRTSLQWI